MRMFLHPARTIESGFPGADVLSALGAAHRASLGRGLVFVLTLAVCSLVLVYAPLACRGCAGGARANEPPGRTTVDMRLAGSAPAQLWR